MEERNLIENDAKLESIEEREDNNIIDEKYNLLADNDLYNKLLNVIRGGNNTLAQSIILQSMEIEADWIETIENGLFSIEQIVKNPKTFIREERELLSIEKAKRVDSIAVRHLSTHTEYIKEIRPDGTIRPSKIMSRQLEQEVAIYENRFVYALVKRLISFIERRYVVIKEKSVIKDNTVLSYDSTFRFGKADVDYKLLMSVKTPNKNSELLEKNKALLEKLELIRQRLMLIEGTEFATIMKKEKPVVSPIMKTNILAGNVDYKNCYNLWIMLSRYNSVGYFVDIQKKTLNFDEQYFDDLSKLTAAGVEAMMVNNNIRKAVYQGIRYDRKIRKKFRVSRNVNYTVEKLSGSVCDTDSDISQYYFERIKKMTGDIEKLSKAYKVDEVEDINVNFRRYFKGLQRINNELFYDILSLREKPDADVFDKQTTLQKKRKEVAFQKKILQKNKLITKLKKEELRLSILREQTQEKKLKRLEKTLLRMEKRAEKIKLAKEKERLSKANAKNNLRGKKPNGKERKES